MVTIYSPSKIAAGAIDTAELKVAIEESRGNSAVLDATFVSMRRSLRSELRDVQLSEWVAPKVSEEIIKGLSD